MNSRHSRVPLDPIKNSIAIAGLFITGLSLFRRRNRHHEHHVRERERTDKRDWDTQSAGCAAAHDFAAISHRIDCALSPGRIYRTRVCLRDVFRHRKSFPSFPIHFSAGLVIVSMIVSVMTGLVLRVRAGVDGFPPRSGDSAEIRIRSTCCSLRSSKWR